MCANNAHIVFNRERYMFITNINEAYQASKSQIVTSIMQPTVAKFETVQLKEMRSVSKVLNT